MDRLEVEVRDAALRQVTLTRFPAQYSEPLNDFHISRRMRSYDGASE